MTKLHKLLLSVCCIIFAGSVIFSACTWTSGGEDGIIFPEKNVSYLLHIKPFLSMNCSYSPCHSSFDFAGGIALTEYHNVMQVSTFIVAGNPDASRFVWILENKSPHFTNFYRGNITDNHIAGIRQWIKEGAINN